jgi:hypothetical protein
MATKIERTGAWGARVRRPESHDVVNLGLGSVIEA